MNIVDMFWDGGKLVKAVIRSILGNPCKVRYGEEVVEFGTDSGESYQLSGYLTLHLH